MTLEHNGRRGAGEPGAPATDPRVVRIFPNARSCLRSRRRLLELEEYHEDWINGRRYLRMEPLSTRRRWKEEAPEVGKQNINPSRPTPKTLLQIQVDTRRWCLYVDSAARERPYRAEVIRWYA